MDCEKNTQFDCYLRDGNKALTDSGHCVGCHKTQADILADQTIIALTWLTTDAKWRADETKLNVEEGSQGGYSLQLTAALNLLARWKGLKK